HGAGAFQRAQAMPRPQRYAPLGPQGARLRGADPEVVPGHAQLRPAQTEHLHGKGELEGAKAVISEDGDRSVPKRPHLAEYLRTVAELPAAGAPVSGQTRFRGGPDAHVAFPL